MALGEGGGGGRRSVVVGVLVMVGVMMMGMIMVIRGDDDYNERGNDEEIVGKGMKSQEKQTNSGSRLFIYAEEDNETPNPAEDAAYVLSFFFSLSLSLSLMIECNRCTKGA